MDAEPPQDNQQQRKEEEDARRPPPAPPLFLATMDAHLMQEDPLAPPPREDIPFTRVLEPDAPQRPYRRRQHERKSVIHWGQRKLLMAEIEFLTVHAHLHHRQLVVYAGAAPGTHINWLADLFPQLAFVLVDPNPFVVVATERIRIVQDYFTDDMARDYADQSVLFISDVRTADWRHQDADQVETRVARDMQAQRRWVELMSPVMSLLKFRLPYSNWSVNSTTEYFDGDLFLPVWGPQTTTETRLVTQGITTRIWDHTIYEQQMFYFNTVTRLARYPHQVLAQGIDHCYDCASEIHILQNYLRKYGPWHLPCPLAQPFMKVEAACINGTDEMNWIIARLTELISEVCSFSGRTLSLLPRTECFSFMDTIKNHPFL